MLLVWNRHAATLDGLCLHECACIYCVEFTVLSINKNLKFDVKTKNSMMYRSFYKIAYNRCCTKLIERHVYYFVSSISFRAPHIFHSRLKTNKLWDITFTSHLILHMYAVIFTVNW